MVNEQNLKDTLEFIYKYVDEIIEGKCDIGCLKVTRNTVKHRLETWF